MNLNVLQMAICSALFIVLALLCMFGLNNLLLLCLRVKMCRRDGVNVPANIEVWPYVTVQVATYNEGIIVGRLLESCLRLNYPADKIEIIVVDDSSDETISILQEYERRYYPRIKVIHRSERKGYKAGALNEALKHSKGDYILILDADSIPEPDLLRKTIPLFLADEKLGFVQVKPGYINAESSWLTRTLALVNDWFAVFLQSTLSRCGMMISFLGHGGVFRRRALEDIGGWMSDTIAEDIDAAYRIQLKGWRAVFFEGAESLEEVPPSYYSAVKRFKRHIKGPIQNLIKHAKSIIRHGGKSAIEKFEALIQLAYPLVYPLGLACIILAILMYLFVSGPALDQFWLTAPGFIDSLLLLLMFPYAAFIVSLIPSLLVVVIALLFAVIILPESKATLKRRYLELVFGVALIWNDNIINCLMPIIEIIIGKEGEWIPTERALSKGKKNSREERLREGLIRIVASILVLIALAVILFLNFSLDSFGIIIPSILWLYSAHLIIRG
ncbi:MAG: glycosyltransferase [Candidatus Bathyarchaeia archaeon]